MKLTLIFLSGCLLAVLGNSYTALSQTSKAKTTTKAVSKTAAVQKTGTSKQEIEEGKQLMSKSDCMACHTLQSKMVGPAYIDVAKKYAVTDANINLLAQKVISGGSGVWGDIPMPPHPALPSADVKKIVRYILSLNSK